MFTTVFCEKYMNEKIERDLGPQPISELLAELNLKPHDLVAASTQQLTHKMVSRACKGRRLTLNTQTKILNALNLAARKNYSLRDLFNY
jgi:hypothetical protein